MIIGQNEFIGKNSIKNLKFILKDEKIKKVLVFGGSKSFSKSGAKNLLKEYLEKKNKKIFLKKNSYGDITELVGAISILKTFKPDLIIAVGGGSVMDLAKCANTLYYIKNLNKNISLPNLIINKKFCALCCIPTTAGSGAEATRHAVIYSNKIKYSIESSYGLPDFIISDSSLILSAPKKISASAGIDAFAQAIESLLSVKSSEESINFAIQSLKYSKSHFVTHVNKPSLTSSYKMSLAACLAGKAINISKTIAPHAISYPMTSHFNVSHGQAVCITLSDILKYNFKNSKYSVADFDVKKRFNKIFKALNLKNINDLEGFIKKIISDTGLTNDIADLGVTKKSDIDLILSNINMQRLKNNPVSITNENIKMILKAKVQNN
jgi:alcohol dehydrogenase